MTAASRRASRKAPRWVSAGRPRSSSTATATEGVPRRTTSRPSPTASRSHASNAAAAGDRAAGPGRAVRRPVPVAVQDRGHRHAAVRHRGVRAGSYEPPRGRVSRADMLKIIVVTVAFRSCADTRDRSITTMALCVLVLVHSIILMRSLLSLLGFLLLSNVILVSLGNVLGILSIVFRLMVLVVM